MRTNRAALRVQHCRATCVRRRGEEGGCGGAGRRAVQHVGWHCNAVGQYSCCDIVAQHVSADVLKKKGAAALSDAQWATVVVLALLRVRLASQQPLWGPWDAAATAWLQVCRKGVLFVVHIKMEIVGGRQMGKCSRSRAARTKLSDHTHRKKKSLAQQPIFETHPPECLL